MYMHYESELDISVLSSLCLISASDCPSRVQRSGTRIVVYALPTRMRSRSLNLAGEEVKLNDQYEHTQLHSHTRCRTYMHDLCMCSYHCGHPITSPLYSYPKVSIACVSTVLASILEPLLV